MAARVAAVILGLLLMARVAHAQKPAADTDQEARDLFRKAEISFNLGKFPEALADYQAAYQAKPLPGFLFNIAQCYRHMGKYERARFFYRRYLAVDPKTPNRRLVNDLITEVTGYMDNPASAPPLAAAPPPAAVPAAAASAPAPPLTALTAVPPPGPEATVAVDAPDSSAAAEPGRRPVYKRWWFWSGLVVIAAGGAAAAYLLTRDGASHGTLDPIDGR